MRATYRVGVGKVSRYSFWWNSEYVPGPAKFSKDMARKPEFALCWLLAFVGAVSVPEFRAPCAAARSLEVCGSFGTHLTNRKGHKGHIRKAGDVA
jgi:hypothetical protein